MMSLTNSQQIQVYESLGQDSGNIIHVFEKNTIINIHPVLSNPQPENPDLSISLSFELVIVMLLILTLPILIYIAYRYGKKMGKKEQHSYPSSKSNSPVIKKLTLSQRSTGTGDTLSESGEAELEPSLPIVNFAEVPPSLSNSNPKQLVNKEDANKLEKSQSNSSSQNSESPKTSLETSSDKQDKEFCLDGKANSTIIENEINQANYQLNPCFDEPEKITENFTFLMKKTYDKENKVGNLSQSFDDEKIKLHTDDSQIKKQQIEVKLSFERKDGALQKVETQEIITVYCDDVKEPEKNALMLKKVYENYQNDSAMIDKHFIDLNNRGRNRKTTALVSLRTPPVYTNVLNLANQICLPEIETFDAVPESQEASKSSPEPCTLEELLEKDDLPHETGKFNKIFKNAEVIGQGSFGEVFKVVHKLDGKIYAVKKVKLRFGKLEELQQKSKVFREVFAMTDLHHPNIVRYSTCWVEIETGKESALTSTRENDLKSEYTRREVLREVEEVEQSEQSQSSESSQSPNYHTKTSSMGFEWDVEDEKSKEVEKPVSPVNKKKPKNFAQKKESSVFIKSLSKPLNEDCSNLDNSSPASILSNTERAETSSHGYTLHLYIQMEYCAGENLRNFLDSSKRTVVPDKILKMFKKLLEGVNAIHKRGILHRDLKPANIFLDGDENIKIGDFGLASLDYNEEIRGSSVQLRRSYKGTDRSLSMKIGTPMYSSPEQENGKRYNQKTDIYSLGLILCEMLAELSTHHERYQMFTSLRQSSELPPKFRTKFIRESELILKMTAQCPEERPTAEEIMAEIDRLLQAQISA
jgi:serine/threonine protein kinase